jgi:hypothetical protein
MAVKTVNQRIQDTYPGLDDVPDFLTKTYDLLSDLRARVVELKTLTDELVDDHATSKAAVDELESWAEALGTKLNADTGVADTDYDAVITNSAPATLTASKITAVSKPAPSDPDA